MPTFGDYSSAPDTTTPATSPTPQEKDTGETFLVNKPSWKNPLRWVESASELTGIPTIARKAQGVAHAIKEGDPELARKESLEAAGIAALNVIPVEKILAPVGRGLMNALPSGAKEAIVNWIGPNIAKLTEPVYNAIRKVGSNIYAPKPNELADFEKSSFGAVRDNLTKSYQDLVKNDPNTANEIAPIMKASGNIASNRTVDPFTRPMKQWQEEKSIPAVAKKGEEIPETDIPKLPTQTQETRIAWSPHPLKEMEGLGPVTEQEQRANLHAELVVQSLRNQMSIHGSTGFASPGEATEALANKVNGVRALEPAIDEFSNFVDAEGKKYGINNFSEQLPILREEPWCVKELPEGLRYYPSILGKIFDMEHAIVNQHGFDVPFRENYFMHMVKSLRPTTDEDLRRGHKVLSDFVAHSKSRNLDVSLRQLKGIQDGTITTPEQLGLDNTPESYNEIASLKNYLYDKQIITNAREGLKAYNNAFARAEMAASVENILHTAQVNPDIEFVRYGMTRPEYDAVNTMIDNAQKNLFGKEMKSTDQNQHVYTFMRDSLNKIKKLLASYKPGENYGLPGGSMYHPEAVKAISSILKAPNNGAVLNNLMSFIRGLKAMKLGGYPGSLFHTFSLTQTMQASGQALDMLFVPKVIKTFELPQVKSYLNYMQQIGGVNFARNNHALLEAQQLGDKAIEDAGGPSVKKWIEWMHKGPINHYVWEVQQPADQYVLFNYHMAHAKMDVPEISNDGAAIIAGHLTNWKMGSLRPELMSVMARQVGNYFLLARNWTYRNAGLTLNAIHEWFIKTPAAMGILPPEFSQLFKGGLNAIQNMENLLPEAQDYIRKELADFMGVALAQRMWRLQAMSYLISGHSTFSNEPGHELDIDTNMAEWKKGPSGKYTYHKIYFNNLAFLHDPLNLPPITPPIDVYNATGNKWVFANPMQYIDINKSTQAMKNKSNAIWTLAYDLTKAKSMGETRTEANTQAIKDTLEQAIPIPLETIMKNWDQITWKYGWDTALEVLALAVLGQPRVIEGAAPNVGKAFKKKESKSTLEQIEQGAGLP
jgi:hypothetical protein